MRDPRLAALAGAAALLCALLVVSWLRRRWRSLRARRRAKRSLRGEARAERLLMRAGYEIEARQESTSWFIRVDGEDHEVQLRADLIVSQGGQRYVAEVKTGSRAPQITNVSTRRQLLEYLMAYDVDGVLLIDPEAKEIHDVGFPTRVSS